MRSLFSPPSSKQAKAYASQGGDPPSIPGRSGCPLEVSRADGFSPQQ